MTQRISYQTERWLRDQGGAVDHEEVFHLRAGGPFPVGAITTNAGLQFAPATGTSALHSTDNAATDLTGTMNWIGIATINILGILALSGQVNPTGITYRMEQIAVGIV